MSKDLWEYTLQEQDEGKTYQEILKRKFHFSTKLLQELKKGEFVWVDGNFTFLSAVGKTGQTLKIMLLTAEEATIPGESLPLDILYEDEYFIAINKSAGQVVHPTPRYPTGTIGNAVVGYFSSKGESRPFRPISRLDRNTSGVILIAKNRFGHQQLAWQHQHGLIKKVYLGVVEDCLSEDVGEIREPIRLIPGSFIQRQTHPKGLPSLTYYKVLKKYAKGSLLEFILVTGRTHQIRVHCQAIGHSLLGDDLYGGDTSLISRQALHAYQYSFKHPATGKQVIIKAPVPKDIKILLKTLRLN